MAFYSDDERYGIGDALQFSGDVAPWAQERPSYVPGMDPLEQQAYAQNLAQYLGFADDYHRGVGSGAVNPEYSYTGNKVDFSTLNDPTKSNLDKALGLFKNIGTSALNAAATPKGLAALVPAILAMFDRQGKIGGGTGQGYQGPKQYARSVGQGKYGPIVRYAAEGGLMQAYANGGEAQAYVGGKPLVMEDGGFVFTEEAANKLGKTGIAALGGEMISAPGNGTNDKGITGIIGKNGVTPARVSKDEAYFSKEAVAANGGPKRMYALMNELQRKA